MKAIPAAMAAAASVAAMQAEAAAKGLTVGRLAQQKAHAAIMRASHDKAQRSLPAETWAAMPMKVRTVLVMLGGTSDADPRTVAGMPWESIPADERISVAAVAREMAAGLKNAICLF